MSMNVVGIRPPDDTWTRMKAAYDACEVAGVTIPAEVDNFFDGEIPDPAGVFVDLENTSAVREWKADMAEGFEVNVDLLPAGVKIVRFFNSY